MSCRTGCCKKLSFVFALLALAVAPAAYATYSQDPASCTGTGGGIGISVFACTTSSASSCTAPISGAGQVIAGEFIAYQVTVTPQAPHCAFALGTSGTFNLTLPNGTNVDLSGDASTCSTTTGPASCTAASSLTTGACIGCDGLETGGPEEGSVGNFPIQAVNGLTTLKHVYQVAQTDFVPTGCTPNVNCFVSASTHWGGTGLVPNDIAFTGSTPSVGPELATPQSNPAGTCSATIDKQVSCDLGTTWNDTTGTDDPTGILDKGCIANVGANVEFRFIAANTGGTAVSCTLTDNVTTILPSTTITSLGVGLSTTITGTTTACNLTGSQTGDDTATLGSCTCTTAEGVSVPGTGGTDTATYACCGVLVDKQVSCTNGVPTGAQDVGFVSANQDGTNGCSTQIGQPVSAKYQVENTGNVPLVCSGTGLGLVDTFVVNSLSTFTGTTTVAAGATNGPFTDTNITTCTSTLNSNESMGDKFTASCACQAGGSFNNTVDVSAFDIAQIQCSNAPPSFTITKSCTPVAGTPGSFTADVKVTNVDTVNPVTCQLTDQFVTGTCGTAPGCPVTGGTPVTVSPDPLTVAVSSSGDATGTISGLTATACNQACGSCTNGNLCATATDCAAPVGVTATCVAGTCNYAPNTAAQATCPVGTCFTRTPGFWGTHPAETFIVISESGGSLNVCGEALTNVGLGGGSAIQNLCESGKDFKASSTSPQQLQLIRQCTAAALNLTASGGAGSCEGADPGITATFNSCCDALGPSTCNSGASAAAINASNCITLLDAFNNQFDNVPFPTSLPNGPAQPKTCQVANGDGLTNCTTSEGTIHCGPAN